MNSKKQPASEQSQMNAEEQTKQSSSLILRDKMANTPFWIVKNTEKKEWFVVLGDHRITDIYKYPPDDEKLDFTNTAKVIMEEEKWNIIMRITAVIAERAINEAHLDNIIINRENKKGA